MKNRDYILKEKKETLVNAVILCDCCNICKELGCKDYCEKHPEYNSCEKTVKAWLDEEHVDDLFSLGTIVEYETGITTPTKCLGYYNGYVGANLHRICTYKDNVGKPEMGCPILTSKIKKIY